MENQKLLDPIKNLENEIKKLEEKTFKVYFFTIDSKGGTNGYLSYIYETAYQLKEMGYDVHMLHQEEEFIGVGSWLGEKYANLPHHNIEKDKIEIAPSDVLFIPEFYSNIMQSTKKIPCKRVVIAQNFKYLTQIIPVGASWANFGIKDCVCTTNSLSNRLKTVFPFINIRTVNPVIDSAIFNKGDKPKKLIVNIVAKEETDVNSIVKGFFWKYPMYKWVAFRDLKNLPKCEFAKYLQEAAFTVWHDRDSEFGYTPIECMKSGSIVIGKVPELEPEWMVENNEFVNNGVWYFNNDDVHTLIAGAIESFIKDNINEEIYDEMDKMNDKYTLSNFIENITKVYVEDIFESHKNELKTTLEILKNNSANNK